MITFDRDRDSVNVHCTKMKQIKKLIYEPILETMNNCIVYS